MLERSELDIIIDNDIQHACDCEKIPVLKEKILLGIPRELKINEKYAGIRVTENCIKSGNYSAVGSLCIEELREEKFILLKGGNSMRKISDTIFRESKAEPQISMEFDQLMTSINYAERGFGICFLTDTALKYSKEAPELCIYIPQTEHGERTLYAIHKKSRYLNRAAKAFIDEMCQSGAR
ncbi:MAG: LysR family transcriptional regulator substrate-binding protein, partial [Oscillospiraceae bacterium]|nr:LysR family transcriptional regulator substrate-binding protein [Oscillospiraceae bacterium]